MLQPVIHQEIDSRESRDSHSQKHMSSSDKRLSPIQHFNSFPVQNSLLHLWNICSFVTRQFPQTQFPGSSVKGLEVKDLSLRNCLVFITVLGEKLLQNNQSLQNLCFWGCQEAALSVIWHNRFFWVFFCGKKAQIVQIQILANLCRSVSPYPVRCPVKRGKVISRDHNRNFLHLKLICTQLMST